MGSKQTPKPAFWPKPGREDDKDDNDDNDDGTQHARLSSLEIITLKIPQLSNPHLQGGRRRRRRDRTHFFPFYQTQSPEISKATKPSKNAISPLKPNLPQEKHIGHFDKADLWKPFNVLHTKKCQASG